ncbi:pyruvate synthase subunit PorA [Methanobrevibacter wolinii]|uniref:pyruvate synthase subunit PorA n=1 Tax=Methanobrevibacter wolinii TaxID=190977 RepID=UPI0005B2B687|nr:pyruvate synthase subunit PorA [Methanobrevibacter wolinii]MDD5960379.1 pyruvate synthase subunit PorA [Methanobrevibacter wolinii]
MTKKVMTATEAISEAVKLAKPKVIPVYPITPMTTVAEHIADYVANGELDTEYIRVESEHSAMSAAIGASSTGVRTFTATSSQGLMYMHEVLFAAAGMRAPIVLADANRAISAPLCIWNDQQDSIAQRDSGWIQLYAEDGQEALDMVLAGFKVAENENVLLPVMITIDGFIITHTNEVVDIPDQEQVDKFLPDYVPKYSYLDPEKPVTVGSFSDPRFYMEARHAMQVAMDKSIDVFEDAFKDFEEIFGRHHDLIDTYRCEDADIIFVALGSVCSTLRVVIDEMRESGEKVGLVKILSYRPFPGEKINEAVKNASKLAVLDKDISFGVGGALYEDMKTNVDKEMYNFIIGLGGKDITPSTLYEILELTKNPVEKVNWVGIEEDE